jgi:hypothetical protein
MVGAGSRDGCKLYLFRDGQWRDGRDWASVGSFGVAGPFSEEAWLRQQETLGPRPGVNALTDEAGRLTHLRGAMYA